MADSYHHGDLRRALVDAATRLVRLNGATQVSLRHIAREAGVSHAAPYHHFPDREALLAEVALGGFEALGEALRGGAEGSADAGADAGPLARLQGAGVAYVVFAVDNPEVYRLMFGGLLSDRSRYPALETAADAAFGVLLELLGPGGAPPGPGAANPAALATWSTVHGLASLMIEGLLAEETAATSSEELARQATLVLGRGLRAYAGPSGGGGADSG
jgi:AcrR family transcriptional regulator